ncbi:unnamed protein product [Paramecium pentaurelia]|uniref:Uncharacterized protein n=1 Tax=Paramecium pentaurelia TaxID=43138 RepID=A0A8S1TPQ5_9CILI|nr:unnamed protein product [Paramecium pentaurelia]
MGCGQSSASFFESRGLIYIYYGTTSGNSSRLAFTFASQIRKLNFLPKVINLSEFEPDQITQQKLSIFFVSTYGVGSCSSDAQKFNSWIFSQERKNDEFNCMSYIVFALGNTNHENYCQFGIRLDKRLEELGAKRLFVLGKGNAAENTTENDYQDWINTGVEQTLIQTYPAQTCDPKKFEQSIQKIKYTNEPENEQLENLDYQAQKYKSSITFTINEIKELKKKPTLGNSTLFIDLIADNINYKTASNIAIYPQNSDQDINELCNQLRFDKNMKFEIVTTSKHPFPNPISIQNYLRKYCDFTGLITKKQLMELSNLAINKQIKEELLKASSFEGRDFYEEHFQKKRESLLTVIKKYNIRNLSIEQLLEICPLITPRFFTIASSNMKYPKNIHILASQLILYEKRLGLCSQYFSTLKKGSIIKGYLSDSKFTFPKNPKVPVLLIGPGAGLAPMRALIQERDYYLESNKLDMSPFQGNMDLLFGCRTEDEYFFEEELKNYEKNGTLSNLKVAFSRKEVKQYVTDIMDLNQIHSHLTMEGLIYICGSSQMGRDITNKIQDMYKQIENIAPYMAFKKISELEQKQQLITELWG